MKNLLFIALIFTCSTVFGQDKNCSDFKTGQFTFSNPKYSDWKITRTDTLQIETNTKTGVQVHSKIVWKSDCEFVLVCQKIVNLKDDNFIGKMFKVNIIKTDGDTYVCSTVGDTMDMELEMVRLVD